jgi:hypothetical protein
VPYTSTTFIDNSEPDILAAELNKIGRGIELAYPYFNVRDPAYAGGAKGDGTTDDRAALTAAFAAAGAVGGTVFSPPGYTYLVSSGVMTVGAACKMDFSGSTIKKANGWSVGGTYSILDVTAANVEIRNLVLDGNAAGGAKGYGITWPGANGRAENVVTQNIAWAGGPGTGVSWAIASAGFVGRNCRALSMSDTGLGFSIGADDVTLLDCHVVGLGDAGGTYAGFYVGAGVDRFTIRGTASRCSFGLMAPGGGPCQDWNVLAFSGIDNGNTSVYLSEVNESHFGPLVSLRPGQLDGYPSGNGIELLGGNDNTFVSLHCTHPTGYATALVLSAHNTFGIITGHLYGADPCVSVQSSHHNTINEIHAHNASFGVSLGAEDDGGNGPANHNHVGTVVAVECAFSAAIIGGTGNTVGRVISRETFTYDSHIYALGVVEFEADANRCRVDSLDHYNAGAAPSGFDAQPLNLVNFKAGSQDCLVLNARSPVGHYVNLQTDAGTGNGVVVV